MHFLKRYFPDYVGPNRRELPRLLAMMALFFLVVCAVGILRPIKNVLALDGLSDTDFYKVYLVSAAVMLFVPAFNKLSDWLPWRWLIPAIAISFAIELVLFRVFYIEGSTAFGMIFYGWYDLFAAALVAQFFMATQLFFNARSAKQAYPLVIAGGSIGATLGGAITGFFSHKVGTPNLMLVAAALIMIFAVALPFVWSQHAPGETRKRTQRIVAREATTLFRNRQIRFIAISVLLTILVKQLVDYQFNTLTKEVFQTRDAMSAFQGKFNAVTQWLPVVALAALQPLLRRWGVGLAALLLPIAMLGTNVGLVIWWGLWAAVAAKGAETSLRYSTERASRELLYVPVPEEIKLKAKAYIDVAIEKGLGKVLSAGLIALLLLFKMTPREMTFVGIGLGVAWMFSALKMRREYVHTLAQSIEGRFANLRGSFASIVDPSARAAVKKALTGNQPLQVAFALDLVSQSAPRDIEELSAELHALLTHPAEAVREKALRVLARIPAKQEQSAVHARLHDEAAPVREAAVEALCAAGDPQIVLGELLESANPRERTAALACLARGVVATDTARWITREYIDQNLASARAGDREARLEVALAAGALKGDEEAVTLVSELAGDADARVRLAALHSAARLQSAELYGVLLRALSRGETRAVARDALIAQGAGVEERLQRDLLDRSTPDSVRRQIPGVLANLPSNETAAALIQSYLAPETGQLLDYRSLKALGKLRAQEPTLTFDRAAVLTAVRREVAAAKRYEEVAAAVLALNAQSNGVRLLCRSLGEAWSERQESTFRFLGLLFPPDETRNCHNAVTVGRTSSRANALEWLEHHVGASLFAELQPVLRERSTTASRSPTAMDALRSLEDDNDEWIARLAARSQHELNGGVSERRTQERDMDLIEKVFLLQQVDLLQGARSAHLALLASIAHEQDYAEGAVLLKQNEQTDALYVVIRGAVQLSNAQGQVLQLKENAAFGTWALIDRAPSLMTATCAEPTRVLRIERDEFDDLLSENPELAIGLLQGVARRVRALVA